MPSQFFGLTIASSGLRAANAALNTTANNIANTQTVGYSRQQVTQEASNALRTFTTYGCAGAGVDTIAIERVRDQFYNVKYWNNNSKFGEFEVKSYYCKSIEDYFNDDGKTGFKTVFNKMSDALQSVVSNASSDASKAAFIASAKALTDYFNNMYGNLQELQKDINLEIQQTVNEINAIGEKIATLNKQINVIELSGSKANELRDQREKLVDQLSEIIDVDITEYDVTDSNNPDRKTGATRYIVQIAGGQCLVDGTDYNTLTCKPRTPQQKVNQCDVDGLYDIYWSNGNYFKMTDPSMEGKLKGLVELRDGNNGANFHGTVINSGSGYESLLDEDGSRGSIPDADGYYHPDEKKYVVYIKVEEDYLKDMRNCDLSDTGGTITIGNKIYEYETWTYDADEQTYAFVFKDDPKVTVGATAKTSDPIKYQGIPYYMNQMNTWIRGFAEKVNDIFRAGVDSYGNDGCLFFTGNTSYRNTNTIVSIFTYPGTTDLFEIIYATVNNGNQYGERELLEELEEWEYVQKGNGYYDITAGNFAINEDLIKDAGLLATRTKISDDEVQGVEECGRILEMIDLLNSKEKYQFRNGSASQMLEMILSDVALNASDANTFCDTYQGLQNAIDNQRTSISGVDEDEEAVNLVKYQNAYTLASKMIQTLTEVYDRLILQTGV